MSDLIEKATYVAEITKVSVGKSTEKGTPQVCFAIRLKGRRMSDGKLEECMPYERNIIKYFTDNTIDYLLSDLERLGYDRESFNELDSSHPNAFPFVGKEVMCYFQEESYEGKPQEKWNFSSGGGAAGKPLETNELAMLNARFGNRLKRGGAPPAIQRPAAPSHANTAAAQDDEIPF